MWAWLCLLVVLQNVFLYNVKVQPWWEKFLKKDGKKTFECVLPRWIMGVADLFFHEKRRGHLRPPVWSWEGETNCLNVSSCETIRLQGCCQGCFWHLAKSLRAILFNKAKCKSNHCWHGFCLRNQVKSPTLWIWCNMIIICDNEIPLLPEHWNGQSPWWSQSTWHVCFSSAYVPAINVKRLYQIV